MKLLVLLVRVCAGALIVDLTGKPISFLRATARYFIRAFLRIGVILIFFTKKKQALHDKIAKAVVIKLFFCPVQSQKTINFANWIQKISNDEIKEMFYTHYNINCR